MTETNDRDTALASRNRRTLLLCAGVVAGMVGLSFAAVPLYDLFCRVTGFGGTTQQAEAVDGRVIDRTIAVRFDASRDPSLPWHFQPAQKEVSLKVGEDLVAFYRARNLSDAPVTGTASFNVTPLKAGRYFVKVQCFCFTEQRLEPGQEVDMPVYFYVDPAMHDDRNMDDVKTITLSYTFFRMKDEESTEREDLARAE